MILVERIWLIIIQIRTSTNEANIPYTREAAGESYSLIQAKPACLIMKSYARLTKFQRWFRVFSNHWYCCKANMAENKWSRVHIIVRYSINFLLVGKSILGVFKSFQYISIVHSSQLIFHSSHFTVQSSQFILHSSKFTVYTSQFTVHSS